LVESLKSDYFIGEIEKGFAVRGERLSEGDGLS
jgi:hypothetical protein